jgi:putative solute:sodium symporter small subunit
MGLKKSLSYQGSSLRVVSVLLIWFSVSFGCGILFRDWLDANFPTIGNAPFGFWMDQQGSIICFVLLCGILFTMGYIIYFQFLGGKKENYLWGITPEGIGFVGMLINFAVAFSVSKFTPPATAGCTGDG